MDGDQTLYDISHGEETTFPESGAQEVQTAEGKWGGTLADVYGNALDEARTRAQVRERENIAGLLEATLSGTHIDTLRENYSGLAVVQEIEDNWRVAQRVENAGRILDTYREQLEELDEAKLEGIYETARDNIEAKNIRGKTRILNQLEETFAAYIDTNELNQEIAYDPGEDMLYDASNKVSRTQRRSKLSEVARDIVRGVGTKELRARYGTDFSAVEEFSSNHSLASRAANLAALVSTFQSQSSDSERRSNNELREALTYIDDVANELEQRAERYNARRNNDTYHSEVSQNVESLRVATARVRGERGIQVAPTLEQYQAALAKKAKDERANAAYVASLAGSDPHLEKVQVEPADLKKGHRTQTVPTLKQYQAVLAKKAKDERANAAYVASLAESDPHLAFVKEEAELTELIGDTPNPRTLGRNRKGDALILEGTRTERDEEEHEPVPEFFEAADLEEPAPEYFTVAEDPEGQTLVPEAVVTLDEPLEEEYTPLFTAGELDEINSEAPSIEDLGTSEEERIESAARQTRERVNAEFGAGFYGEPRQTRAVPRVPPTLQEVGSINPQQGSQIPEPRTLEKVARVPRQQPATPKKRGSPVLNALGLAAGILIGVTGVAAYGIQSDIYRIRDARQATPVDEVVEYERPGMQELIATGREISEGMQAGEPEQTRIAAAIAPRTKEVQVVLDNSNGSLEGDLEAPLDVSGPQTFEDCARSFLTSTEELCLQAGARNKVNPQCGKEGEDFRYAAAGIIAHEGSISDDDMDSLLCELTPDTKKFPALAEICASRAEEQREVANIGLNDTNIPSVADLDGF